MWMKNSGENEKLFIHEATRQFKELWLARGPEGSSRVRAKKTVNLVTREEK